MRREGLVILFLSTLVGFGFFVPTTDYESLPFPNHAWTHLENTLSGVGDNFEDFVDQTSDLHAPSDIGTHSVLSDMQDFGLNYDQILEENTGGATPGALIEDYVDQTSDVDGSGDYGAHTAFVNLQNTDDTFDQLSESIPRVPPSFVSSTESWSTIGQSRHSFNYSLASASGNNRLVVIGVAWEDAEVTGDVTAITFNSVSILSEQIGKNTSVSGFFSYVAGWYILDANLPALPGSYNITVTVNEPISREIIVFVAEYTGVEQEVPDDTGSHQTPAAGDTTFAVTTNEDNALIVAVGCTGGLTAMTSVTGGITNREDVIDPTVTSQGAAIADYIGAPAGDLTVGWTGLATRSCSIGGVWSGVPSSSGYQMDLEVEFTNVVDFLATEELCIKTGIFSGSEDINVTYWSGSSWTSITSDLTANQWNNFTVSLTSSTYTIKFGGSFTTSDAIQDTWNIDAVLLQVSGGGVKEDTLDGQSDVDGSADVGTHSSFIEMQTADLTYDSLTEANTVQSLSGTVGFTSPGFSALNQLELNEIILCQFSLAEDNVNVYSMSAYGRIDGFSGIDVVRYLIYSDSAGSPGAFLGRTVEGTWSTFATWTTLAMETNLTLSAGTYWLGLWSNDELRPYYQFGAVGQTALNVSSTPYPAQPDPFGLVTEWQNWQVSIYFNWDKDLPDNYELDLEVQFTDLPTTLPTEKLCIRAGTLGAEDIIVQIRTDSSTWANVTTDLIGSTWNNFTINFNVTTVTIRFIDGSPSGDAIQDTWQIDVALVFLEHPGGGVAYNYELDLEVGWTAADFDETNEELCIYPVTGGGWPTEDIKVDVWNGAWINVIVDLIPDQWNNVSVSSYLTGSAFEIRFLGGNETGDVTQDTWEIDAVLLHMWTTSAAPANDQAPTLDNPSDTDNMYAQYQEYQVTVYVSDPSGFADIDYLEVGLWDNTQTTEYCRFRYDEDTDTFSKEYDGGSFVSLNTGSSTATKGGNDIDATFYFTVDWDFPDSTDLDAQCYVVDTLAESDTSWYEVNWDVETRLEYSVAPSVDDGSGTADRGDVDSSFSLTGTVIYYNSIDDNPLTSTVDVWVSASEYGTNIGPWSDTTLTMGSFNVTCYSDDVVGRDTYTIKIVEEGAGSGGIDLYYTSSASDTYIADQVKVQTYSVDDSRVDINDSVNVNVTLVYDFDNSAVTDGSVTVNGLSATHQGAGVWLVTDIEAAVTAKTYNTVVYSGGTHGLTSVDQNGQSLQVIWDQIVVQTTLADDTRVNINDPVEIRVTLWLAYDSTFLGSGDSVTLDGTSMTWDSGNSWFDLTVSQSTVGIWRYFVNSSMDTTFGISSLTVNSQSIGVIWDQIQVQTTLANDTRANTNDDVEIRVTLWLAYDNSFLGSGDIVTLDESPMTWDSANSWFDLSVSQSSVGVWTYFVNSSVETTFGISMVDSSLPTQLVIWDSLIISITDPIDQRVDVGSNASGIIVTALYAYDGTVFDGSLTLNNTIFQYASSQKQGYTVLGTSGDSYGIDAIQTNDYTFCVWDRVLVVTVVADEIYHDPNDDAVITVELRYEYDDTPVLTGTMAIASYPLTHISSGVWEVQVTIGSYLVIDFDDLTSCDAALFGIGTYTMNGNSVSVYWDRLEFYAVSVADDRISVGESAEIQWSARLEDAGISVSTGVTAQMTGGLPLTPSSGFLIDTVFQGAVGSMTYAIISASLGEINQFRQSTGDVTIIWDQIRVVSVTASSLSLDINQATEIRVTLVYEFDNSPVIDGTVYLDNNGVPVAMVYDSSEGYWTVSITKSSAADYSFTLHSIEGNSFGITSLNLDGKDVTVEWVGVVGPAPDTMTLMVLGGGVGIAVIGVAIVASKRRKPSEPTALGEIDPTGFGIESSPESESTDDVVAAEIAEVPHEPIEISEPDVGEFVEPEAEHIEPDVMEEEPSTDSAVELEEPQEIEPERPQEPELETSSKDEVMEKQTTKTQVDRDAIWTEPRSESDELVFSFHPEHLPEETLTKQPPPTNETRFTWDDAVALSNMLALTKTELIELVPEDYKATTSEAALKRMTKKELIDLIELLRVRDTF